MQKLIVKILEQKGRNRNLDRRFKLDSLNFVDVQLGLKSQDFRYPVNLLFLNEKPVKSTILPWKWILISLFLLLTTLVIASLYILPVKDWPFANLASQYRAELTQWIKPLLVGSALLMLISIIVSRRKIQRYVVMHTKYSQAPLIKFLQDTPDKTELENFIREIQHRIVQANKNCKYNIEEILSAELTGLRDLCDHNILSEKEYKHAKLRIMKTHTTLNRDEINDSRKQKLSLVQYQ